MPLTLHWCCPVGSVGVVLRRRLAGSKLTAVKDVGEAMAPRSAGVAPMKHADPPDAVASIPAARALWQELGNKCLYFNGVRVHCGSGGGDGGGGGGWGWGG